MHFVINSLHIQTEMSADGSLLFVYLLFILFLLFILVACISCSAGHVRSHKIPRIEVSQCFSGVASAQMDCLPGEGTCTASGEKNIYLRILVNSSHYLLFFIWKFLIAQNILQSPLRLKAEFHPKMWIPPPLLWCHIWQVSRGGGGVGTLSSTSGRPGRSASVARPHCWAPLTALVAEATDQPI